MRSWLPVRLSLRSEMGLGIDVAADAKRRLRWIDLSHNGTTLLRNQDLLVSPTADEEEDGEADESKTNDRPDDCSGNPSLGFLPRLCYLARRWVCGSTWSSRWSRADLLVRD